MKQEPVELLQQALGEGAPWYISASALVMMAIRIFRRPDVQVLLPRAAQWSSLPKPARWGIVFVASGLASWVASLASGQTGGVAAIMACLTAVGAMLGHKVTKVVGHAQTANAINRKGLGYRPGSIRTSLDILLPVDHKAVQTARRLQQSADDAAKRAKRRGKRPVDGV